MLPPPQDRRLCQYSRLVLNFVVNIGEHNYSQRTLRLRSVNLEYRHQYSLQNLRLRTFRRKYQRRYSRFADVPSGPPYNEVFIIMQDGLMPQMC